MRMLCTNDVKKVISMDADKSNSATEKNEKSEASKQVMRHDADEYDDYDYEAPKTAGQKVAFYSGIVARLGLMGLAVYMIYVVGNELFPGRMGPNSLFSEAFEIIRVNDNITEVTGTQNFLMFQLRNLF